MSPLSQQNVYEAIHQTLSSVCCVQDAMCGYNTQLSFAKTELTTCSISVTGAANLTKLLYGHYTDFSAQKQLERRRCSR